jgi:PTH2 family peptidyl-tRNA hydrolase
LQQQQKQKGGEWLSGSFKPENFIPGLIIGFICGFLIDLSKPTTNHLSNKIFSSSNLQPSASSNADQDLKMVWFVHFLKLYGGFKFN